MPRANGHIHQENGLEPVPGMPLDASEHDSAASDTAAQLAAWGRGEVDLDRHELQEALDAYAIAQVNALAERIANVTAPDEAIEFLIQEGLISADDARADV